MAGVSPLLALLTGGLKGYVSGQDARRQAQAKAEAAAADRALKQRQQDSLDAYHTAMATNGANRVLTGDERARTDRLYRLGLDGDGNPIAGLGGGTLGARNRGLDETTANHQATIRARLGLAAGKGDISDVGYQDLIDATGTLFPNRKPLGLLPGLSAAPDAAPIVPPPGDPMGRTLPASVLLGGESQPMPPPLAPPPVLPPPSMLGPLGAAKIAGTQATTDWTKTRTENMPDVWQSQVGVNTSRAANLDADTRFKPLLAHSLAGSRHAMAQALAAMTPVNVRKGLAGAAASDAAATVARARAAAIPVQLGIEQQRASTAAGQLGVAQGTLDMNRWKAHNPAAGGGKGKGGPVLPNGLTVAEDTKLAQEANDNATKIGVLGHQLSDASNAKNVTPTDRINMRQQHQQLTNRNAQIREIRARGGLAPVTPGRSPGFAVVPGQGRVPVPAARPIPGAVYHAPPPHHINRQPRAKNGRVTGPPKRPPAHHKTFATKPTRDLTKGW